MNNIKATELYKQILNKTNIYNAIYSLESYVFEKGLLDAESLTLYNDLTDKYNNELITDIIERCSTRLEDVLCSEVELFDIQVFFRMKDYKDDEGVRFRPIHTSDLITQICLVCLLTPIMFEDSEGKRYNSDISSLLPSNFYGNIPSRKVDNLFVNWKVKYKEYSEAIINKYNEYIETQEYSHEVCLDLEDFFPSISPHYIFHYILKKLSPICKTEADKLCLRSVLTKLLFFNIRGNSFRCWDSVYYPERSLTKEALDSFDNSRMCRGIPQGLPQAYFFGNLCMTEVAKIVEKEFKGDSYYYVDDSVIYTNSCKTDEMFTEKIQILNEHLDERIKRDFKLQDNPLLTPLQDKIQKAIIYKVSFHEEGKSSLSELHNAYDNLQGLQNLARQISIAAVFYDTLDDVEDTLTKAKLDTLLKSIQKEIDKCKSEVDKTSNNKPLAYNLKLLKRYKRFFLYRSRLLEIRQDGEVTNRHIVSYRSRFQIKNSKPDTKALFDLMDEDIFMAESRLLLSTLNGSDGRRKSLYDSIVDFEQRIAETRLNLREGFEKHLYYVKDLKSTIRLQQFNDKAYETLQNDAKELVKSYSYSSDKIKRDKIKYLLEEDKHIKYNSSYFKFVRENSNEFKRKIYNTFISQVIGVEVGDALTFNKQNNRSLEYYELRILVFLRNRKFQFDEFKSSSLLILAERLEDRGVKKIDTLLFEVIHLFIGRIKNPQLIDNLILTHRLVNGLWKNGSKFLNSYTLHNEEHAVDLIKNCIRLLRVIDYLSIKERDYYALFLACYLHDISMVIHPNLSHFISPIKRSDVIATNFVESLKEELNSKDFNSSFKKIMLNNFKSVFNYFENHVRDNHTKHSARFIKNKHDSYLNFIENSILQIVADVSEAHGYDSSEIYGRKSMAKDDLFSVKYMMILLRLADLLDMTKDRISYYILKENITQMERISQFHWISHLITDECNIKASYHQDESMDNYLQNGSIVEKIQVEIILNVKNVSHIDKAKACKGYDVQLNDDSLTIDIKDENTKCGYYGNCPFLCKWIQNKHNYLFVELVELKKYLRQVNNSLFRTEICVNLKFSNSIPLDNEFMDIIDSYLIE